MPKGHPIPKEMRAENHKKWWAIYYAKNRKAEHIRTKKWRDKNKKQIKEKQCNYHKIRGKTLKTEHRLKAKITVFSYYCDENIHCVLHTKYFPKDHPITDLRILCIDHINGGGSKQRDKLNGGGYKLYSWLIKNNFPKGYQVVCQNCNWMKRAMNKEYPFLAPEVKANE